MHIPECLYKEESNNRTCSFCLHGAGQLCSLIHEINYKCHAMLVFTLQHAQIILLDWDSWVDDRETQEAKASSGLNQSCSSSCSSCTSMMSVVPLIPIPATTSIGDSLVSSTQICRHPWADVVGFSVARMNLFSISFCCSEQRPQCSPLHTLEPGAPVSSIDMLCYVERCDDVSLKKIIPILQLIRLLIKFTWTDI